MNIKNYPYGKVNKRLKKAVNWLNKNKRKIEKSQDDYYRWEFDFPDYWNMPFSISCKLTSDEVDWIQSEVIDWNFGE